jgi:hypothetical protein
MRRSVNFICGFLLAAVLPAGIFLMMTATRAVAEKRVAIVIGINEYDNLRIDQQLKKAVNDAKAVGDSLAAVGFEVLRGENVARLEFNRLWQRFLNRLEPGDTVAFFFAGHGVEIAGSNFLLARDAPRAASGEEDLLKGETIGLAKLLDDLRARRPKVSLLILDACRDNPFPQPSGRSVGASRGLARVEAPEGTFVMFSAGTGEAALDRLSATDADANSVYTRRLLPLMMQPGLSLPDLAQELRRQVRELAGSVHHLQTPAYYDEVVGRFCLAGCEGGAVIASVPPRISTPAELPRPAPTSPKIDVPNEPLPADIPVDPEVLRMVETNPFFSNAPAVSVRSYDLSSVVNYAARGSTSTTNTTAENATIHWLRQGIIRVDKTAQEMTSYQGGKSQGTRQTKEVMVANGLISLGSRQVYNASPTPDITHLLRMYNLQGRIFPMEVGNRFSYEATYQQTTKTREECTTKNTCEVTKRYDAVNFHPELNGAAYIVTCDSDTIYKRSKTYTGSMGKFGSKVVRVFFEELGSWVDVDPVNPTERVVYRGEPDRYWGSTWTGTSRLRSIGFER